MPMAGIRHGRVSFGFSQEIISVNGGFATGTHGSEISIQENRERTVHWIAYACGYGWHVRRAK